MEFRDFEIEEHGTEIIISQNREDDFVDRIHLSKEQLQFFIDALVPKESLNIGYMVDVQFKELPQPLRVIIDTPKELGQLQKDIEMGGFGIECELDDSSRILYKLED